MWYSIYTVGDLDIDQEHANIDYMLSSLSSESSDFREKLCLLIDSVILHFQSEEDIAQKRGYDMHSDHLAIHAKLTKDLQVLKSSLLSGIADPESVPENIQEILKLHILEFDRFLIPKSK